MTSPMQGCNSGILDMNENNGMGILRVRPPFPFRPFLLVICIYASSYYLHTPCTRCMGWVYETLNESARGEGVRSMCMCRPLTSHFYISHYYHKFSPYAPNARMYSPTPSALSTILSLTDGIPDYTFLIYSLPSPPV